MARLSLREIEARVAPLGNRDSYDREFIFDLLLAFGRSPGNITRLRSTGPGSLNVASNPSSEVAQKGVLYFREFPPSTEEELLSGIQNLVSDPAVIRYSTRFVMVSDYRTLLAKDTLTSETLISNLADIADHFTFFLPWANMEKAQYTAESHADVKAAERMAKLFDELITVNPELNSSLSGRHSLNIFFSRLLFCFFAEDTGIFRQGQFTSLITGVTLDDGSDRKDILHALFTRLDSEDVGESPPYLKDFPYVNGRLFEQSKDSLVPVFSTRARKLLVENGNLKWSEINPDIFGSMFQAIVTPGQRSELGQHYTSVPNILKTIEPLFLDDLRAEFDNAFDSEKRLKALLDRIARIRIFDPACGSGNFLVIAYKELRKLEHAILERLGEIRGQHHVRIESVIDVENFFGIEIDDFAAEIAVLSLWIAKHQMNLEFEAKFGSSISLIPLTQTGRICRGNSNRIDWNSVCPNDGKTEIYLIGIPPYKGARGQTAEMKQDFDFVFEGRPYSKNLDYIALWFVKGSHYIRDSKAQLAFVTTNSVAQGEHVGLMFPEIFRMGLEIGYAYTSFKWENNARRKAGVTVAVISLRNRASRPKFIYSDDIRIQVRNINGYLADGDNFYLTRRRAPMAPSLPPMVFGSMPIDGGHLILSREERDYLVSKYPDTSRVVKAFLGANEYINGLERYALWLDNNKYREFATIPELQTRVEQVRDERLSSNRQATRELASTPWQFGHIAHKETPSIIVPSVSSERREYIPIGFLGPETVISNAAFAIYDAELWVFGLITSRIHMAWTRAIGGKLKTDYRYSNTIVYNNFPVPAINGDRKKSLEALAARILDVREYYPELTLGELYDPDKMLETLRQAHLELDDFVDALYRQRDFAHDTDRLGHLFDMYSKKEKLDLLH